jgi:trans-aconitate methyltransferase
MTGARAHWDEVYRARPEDRLTWFEANPRRSLDLIRRVSSPEDGVIDVGGGASRLAGALLAEGYGDVTVLDLSARALEVARAALGRDAARIDCWIVADLLDWHPARTWKVWHDRAVFHFLTGHSERAAYVEALSAALAPGGHAILATFADDGPETCSGLAVQRYSPAALAETVDLLAPGLLAPIMAERFLHPTPLGRTQAFQVSVFRRPD